MSGFSLMGALAQHRAQQFNTFTQTELSPRYFVMENVPGMAVGKHQMWLLELKTEFKAGIT